MDPDFYPAQSLQTKASAGVATKRATAVGAATWRTQLQTVISTSKGRQILLVLILDLIESGGRWGGGQFLN